MGTKQERRLSLQAVSLIVTVLALGCISHTEYESELPSRPTLAVAMYGRAGQTTEEVTSLLESAFQEAGFAVKSSKVLWEWLEFQAASQCIRDEELYQKQDAAFKERLGAEWIVGGVHEEGRVLFIVVDIENTTALWSKEYPTEVITAQLAKDLALELSELSNTLSASSL